jgi:glycosyltransferase involved in cell wall biosynthesis
MKILHVCDNLYNGGVQRIMITTIDSMPEHEHHVIYLAMPENLKDAINAPSTLIKQGKGLMLLKTVWQIYRYCKKNKIDIITSGIFNAFFISRLAALLLPKIKHVTVYQATWFMDQLYRAKFYASLDRITHFKRFHYIAVSEAVKKHVFEKVRPKYKVMDVVYNCAGDYYFTTGAPKAVTPQSKLKFIFVGNNFPEKNIIYLVDLFYALDPSRFELDIVGGGMQPFEDIAKARNCSNIIFHGIKKVTLEMLAAHDVYVASGIGEGSPLATIEAMAVGLPTAVANTDAYREVTGNVGYFFDPLKIDTGIATLNQLYNEQDKLKEISVHHYHYARNFTTQKYVDTMKQYYKNMMQ